MHLNLLFVLTFITFFVYPPSLYNGCLHSDSMRMFVCTMDARSCVCSHAWGESGALVRSNLLPGRHDFPQFVPV